MKAPPQQSGTSQQWWDPQGPMRLLHAMTPIRLAWILKALDLSGIRACSWAAGLAAGKAEDWTAAGALLSTDGRDGRSPCSLEGLHILDVGCGGGLISQPLADLGASVVGVDPCPQAVEAATRRTQDWQNWTRTCSSASGRPRGEESDRHVCRPHSGGPLQAAQALPPGSGPRYIQGAIGDLDLPAKILAAVQAGRQEVSSFCEDGGACPLFTGGEDQAQAFGDQTKPSPAVPVPLFDVGLVMDMLEHVPAPFLVLKTLFDWIRPGGILVGSTLNRTLLSRVLAIGLAQRWFGWVAPDTHRGDLFMTPRELDWMVQQAGFGPLITLGIAPAPLWAMPAAPWTFTDRQRVNYVFWARRL